MRVSPHTAQAFQKAPLSGTRLKSSNQATNFFVAFLVYHDFSAILPDWGVNLEAGFCGDTVSADRAVVALPPPDCQQFFPPLGAVEQLFALSFLKIVRPIFIKRICFRYNFLESDDFCIGCIFEFAIERLAPSILIFIGNRECPLTRANVVPVFLRNPSVALFLMSAFCPLPQAFVYLVVNPAEHLRGHDVSLVIYPAPDNGIELAYRCMV